MYGRLLTGLAVLAVAPFLTGCAGMSKTAQGAGVGGLVGTGAGAAIGSTSGNAGKGAVIGGILGAVTGGLIGNDMDQHDKAVAEEKVRQAEAQAAAASTQLGLADVMQMAKDGQSDSLIINQIRTTHSTYQLTSEDIRMLSANGVSEPVIMEMQNRRPDMYPRYPRGRYIYGPPPVYYGPPPVLVVPPPPPPPPPVGFGVGVSIRN